jgi:hypothetical protein
VKLKEAKFIAKERECLTLTHDLKFNGNIIHLQNNNNSNSGITLMQERQYKNLKLVYNKETSITSNKGVIR